MANRSTIVIGTLVLSLACLGLSDFAGSCSPEKYSKKREEDAQKVPGDRIANTGLAMRYLLKANSGDEGIRDAARKLIETVVKFKELDEAGLGNPEGHELPIVLYPGTDQHAISIQCFGGTLNLAVHSLEWAEREYYSKVVAFEDGRPRRFLGRNIEDDDLPRSWAILWNPQDENGKKLEDAVLMEFFAEHLTLAVRINVIPEKVSHQDLLQLYEKIRIRLAKNWKDYVNPCYETGAMAGPGPLNDD